MSTQQYRADNIPPLPAAAKGRQRTLQTPMSFGDYAGIDPNNMQQEDAATVQLAEKEDKDFFKKDWWWDHQRIRSLNDGGMLKIMLFIILGITWLIFNTLTLLSLGLFLDNTKLIFELVAIIILIFSFIWLALVIVSFPIIFNGFFWLFGILAKPFQKQVEAGLDKALNKKCSEFNRTDGMVRLAISAKEKFEAPFIEFDPYIESVVQRGGIYYRLMLIHRYTGKTFTKINLTGISAHQQEVHALWDMLQRYMDITQPLPDMPRLKPFRHLDPLTAARDQETARPARFWRDLDLKVWSETQGAARAKAQREFNWGKLTCKLTPQLGKISMEEYQANKAALCSKQCES